MRASTSVGGRRINVSFLLIGILALTPQVSCQPSKRADNGVDARAVQDFNVNAADIFPVSHNKRLLGGLLSTVLDAVLPGGATTTSTQQSQAASSNQAPAPVPSPTTTQQNQQTTAGSSPTTAGNSSPGVTNQPANPGATSDVASNTQGSGNTASPGKNGGSGQSSVSGGASTATGTVSRIITDHFGNTIAVTGTEPITLTYLTTLPNGVVSTVTEIVTPTSADATNENGASNGLSPGKIAAVIATLITVFLFVFAIAMVLLLLRKRRRSIQLTRSRPTSASSFGSVSDEFAHDSRRNSRAALAPMTSTSSFKTAPAYVDGAKLDFPLPPVPGAPTASTSNQRPLSGVSDGTFDFTFKEQQMSRASIIEERNFYRKIGNYPAAGTYTPFAVAPTSEMGHSDELSFSPTDLDAALERGRAAGKLAYDDDHRSRTSEMYEANPFSDPSPSMAQTASIHDSNNKSNLLAASSARQSSLWRKPTFGSSTGKASVQENRLTTSYDDHTVRSTASTSEYDTARASDNQSLHQYTSSSEDHHSFHSAFEHSSQIPGATGSSRVADNQNPFADTNASSSQTTLVTIKGGALRPDTATSSGKASVVSSVINPQFGRDLSLSPDPKDLFYRAPSTGQSQVSSIGSITRISEDSRRSSDGASTIRASTGSRFAYPSLQQVLERNEGPSATKH